MATIKLVPSAYEFYSIYNNGTVTNPENMYTDTDSATYATFNATSQLRFIIKGFNFSAIPEGSIVNSYSIKLKFLSSGTISTSRYNLVNNGTNIVSGTLSSTVENTIITVEYDTSNISWETLSGYGANLGVTAAAMAGNYTYIYGAEILVDYTPSVIPDVTVTYNNSTIATLSDTGTINLDTESTYCIDDIIINYTRPEVPEDGDNLAYGSLLTSLAGTTWILNQNIDLSVDALYSVNFTTSNTLASHNNFYGLQIQYSSLYEAFNLRFITEQSNIVIYWTDQGWKYDPGSITFVDGTDITNSDLIAWVYANATLQTS